MKIILILILGIFLGVLFEKIDLPLKLQMWGSFYTLPTRKHITINCFPHNKLFATTNDYIPNSINLVCYES